MVVDSDPACFDILGVNWNRLMYKSTTVGLTAGKTALNATGEAKITPLDNRESSYGLTG